MIKKIINILMLVPTLHFVDRASINIGYLLFWHTTLFELFLLPGLAITFFWAMDVKNNVTKIFLIVLVLIGLTKIVYGVSPIDEIDLLSGFMYIVFAGIFFKLNKSKIERPKRESSNSLSNWRALQKIINIILLGSVTIKGFAIIWYGVEDLSLLRALDGFIYLFFVSIFIWVRNKEGEIPAKDAVRILLRWVIDQKRKFSELDSETIKNESFFVILGALLYWIITLPWIMWRETAKRYLPIKKAIDLTRAVGQADEKSLESIKFFFDLVLITSYLVGTAYSIFLAAMVNKNGDWYWAYFLSWGDSEGISTFISAMVITYYLPIVVHLLKRVFIFSYPYTENYFIPFTLKIIKTTGKLLKQMITFLLSHAMSTSTKKGNEEE